MSHASVCRSLAGLFTCLALLTCFCARAGADRIYVSTTGDDGNNGLFWNTAKRTLKGALNALTPAPYPENEVWVAKGTYVEANVVPAGMALYGGFAGTETQLEQRDWTANETVLNGNATASVLTVTGAGITVIDGFTIRNGKGAGRGGGIYGGNQLYIRNNRIVGNESGFVDGVAQGAGIWCGNTCQILNNTISGNGCYTDADATVQGGGIYCGAGVNIVNNTITGNTMPFIANTMVTGYGGGVHAGTDHYISGNTISNNRAGLYGANSRGGGIYATGFGTVMNNTVSANEAWDGPGGGLFGSGNVIGNCFENNLSGGGGPGGGGICQAGMVTGNIIRGNRTFSNGSAVSMCMEVSGNYIEGNVNGVGVVYDCGLVWRNSIVNNTEQTSVVLAACDTIANNLIAGNITTGAAVYGGDLRNNTIVHNTVVGGGATVVNCPITRSNIVAYNSGYGMDDCPIPAYNNVCGNVSGNYDPGMPDPTGTSGNISESPWFVDAANGNYRIWWPSPCVDTGDPTGSGGTDLDGNPRVANARIDMGAYEVPFPRYPVVYVSKSGDNGNDGSSWANAKLTIQAGMNAVQYPGGQVWVAEGTYNEAVGMSENVSLLGGFEGNETSALDADPFSNATTINSGGRMNSVVMHDQCLLNGFRIQNASKTGVLIAFPTATIRRINVTQCGTGIDMPGWGSQRFIEQTSVQNNTGDGIVSRGGTVQDCSISDNGGNGLRLYDQTTVSICYIGRNEIGVLAGYEMGATITGCHVEDNRSTGIYILGETVAWIRDNTVNGNKGHGILVEWGSLGGTGYIERNIVTGNTGIGIRSDGGWIANNLVHGNGIGISIQDETPVYNNTIASNSGVGLHIDNIISSTKTAVNNIIASNAVGVEVGSVPYGSPTSIHHNDVWNNTSVNYSGIPDQSGQNGNITANPEFTGGYRLGTGSPCIDTGDDSVAGTTDLDGRPRILGGHVDMGAYEYYAAAPFLTADVLTALKCAGGLMIPTAGEAWRLNVNTGTPGVTIADATLIARKVAGLDVNP